MAWLDRFRWGRKAADSLELFRELYGSLRSTKAGRTVTLDSALQVSTVFAACRVIGNGMAQVPLKLMRESPNGKQRLPAKDHPLYDVMAIKPNAWMTSFEFRQVMSWHLELSGNFVAVKLDSLRKAGAVGALIPLDPMKTKVEQMDDLSLKYTFTGRDGQPRQIPTERIWHVRGPSWSAYAGLEWLRMAREAIGLAMVTEESASSLHTNGVQTTGMVSVDAKLGSEQYEQMKKWIEREYAGSLKHGKPLIMDRAAKWTSMQMTGVDAQHLETRLNQVVEICRQMGIMPIMVGHSDKVATYASAEQMFLAHAVHCLAPRWEMYEQSMNVNLLTEAERGQGLYFDFVEEGMLRGSMKDTKDVILGYVNGGVMTPNEGRAKLDLNPDDDPESDELRIPVTAVQAPPDGNDPEPASEPAAKPQPKGSGPAGGAMSVTFAAGAIQVKTELHSPDVRIDNIVETPDVKVDIIGPTINVAPPEIKNDIHVAPADVKVDVSKIQVTSMPPRTSTSETERDGEGRIKRVKNTEKDA